MGVKQADRHAVAKNWKGQSTNPTKNWVSRKECTSNMVRNHADDGNKFQKLVSKFVFNNGCDSFICVIYPYSQIAHTYGLYVKDEQQPTLCSIGQNLFPVSHCRFLFQSAGFFPAELTKAP